MTVQKPRLLAAGFMGVSTLAVISAAAVGGDKPRLDRGKRDIENPTEAVLATNSATVPATGKFINPKVEPGKVKWHPTFAAACAAAGTSHKPVLLFQMMGKLDEQFC
ncbi:MAG TPA: hypothetical protein VG013_28855 [Gemmataceae bacterium]|jgi:hypothetical protein|nr:hypothetical protein [Gemmataceae bacterium]